MNCEHCGAPINFLTNPIQCEYCGCSIYKLNSSDRSLYDFSDCTVVYADDTPYAVFLHDPFSADIKQVRDRRKT